MYQIIAFIKFLLKSTNQHGVHSPFVFNLVTQCFYDKKKHNAYQIIKSYKKELRHNNTTIEVTDLGAGSRVFKSNTRSIGAIAKNAGAPLTRTKLLFRIANYFNPKNTLELGSSLGLGTLSLSLGAPNSKVTSIEGCPQTGGFSSKKLKQFNLKDTQVVINDFNDYLSNLNENTSFDLVYFDGNHQKDATIDYFNRLIDHSHNDSVFIFDDIHWSKEMTEAWETILKHPKVTISIDSFYCGFLFFRKEHQQKEHFFIRL